jgi:hypothetical protein
MKATWALTKTRILLAMRNRLFFFFSLLMPMIFLFVSVIFVGRNSGTIGNYVLGALLTTTVMGSFWGLSVQLVTFREQGILRRFRLAPVGAGPLLASSILSNYAMALPTLAVEIAACRWVLHIQSWGNPLALLILITFGSAAFSAFGLIIASVTNTMQETQIINQLIWLGFLFLSGTTVPFPSLPGAVQHISLFLPATYLATGLELAAADMLPWKDLLTDAAGLALTLLASFEVSRRLFRWEPEAKAPKRAKLWVVASLVPIFAFGIYENTRGDMIERVTTSIHQLLERNGPRPSTFGRQDSPQPSDPR